MQRITRLLSGPPTRGRWGALAILGALTVSALLLVAQVGIAGGHLPDLVVEASTDGPLGRGDYREINANGLDKQRFYRESIDAQGRHSETYRENGQVRPINAGVRRWLADIARMSVRPPAPVLPQFDIRTDYKALVDRIAADPAVVARLGTPVIATAAVVNGNVRVDGVNGDADIRIPLRGPKGQAMVAVQAQMKDRSWSLRSVEVE